MTVAVPHPSIDPRRFVIISGYHDYRSKRRASLHFIADELAKRGDVFFLSLRFSQLSRLTDDPRHALRPRGNRVERCDGVSCYLWATPVHACAMPSWLSAVERSVFAAFATRLPGPAKEAVAGADVILVESGIALIYLPLLRRLNPAARILYLASDSLAAINQAETIKRALHAHAVLIDAAILPSPHLADEIPDCIPCHNIPHGIETRRFATIGASPYRPGSRNAVSVGSMLFDPGFFRVAGESFPNVTFHVIGSGHDGAPAPNVIYHAEMAFEATLPFIKHADFAIAAYGPGVAPYLTHTSMKLMQYGALGVPAVCPDVVTAGMPGRFGYRPGDADGIRNAVAAALASAPVRPQRVLDWEEVVDRLIDPSRHADTRLVA